MDRHSSISVVESTRMPCTGHPIGVALVQERTLLIRICIHDTIDNAFYAIISVHDYAETYIPNLVTQTVANLHFLLLAVLSLCAFGSASGIECVLYDVCIHARNIVSDHYVPLTSSNSCANHTNE